MKKSLILATTASMLLLASACTKHNNKPATPSEEQQMDALGKTIEPGYSFKDSALAGVIDAISISSADAKSGITANIVFKSDGNSVFEGTTQLTTGPVAAKDLQSGKWLEMTGTLTDDQKEKLVGASISGTARCQDPKCEHVAVLVSLSPDSRTPSDPETALYTFGRLKDGSYILQFAQANVQTKSVKDATDEREVSPSNKM